jgi:cellulose synthase/poly-beta-1,6-N-acetylglucosamine synthase-like glycosyltransferase
MQINRNTFPKITVIIPIKNEAKFIASTIERILGQDYPAEKIEIITACGDSEDGSFDIVSAMASKEKRVKVFHNPVGLASGGRNIGIRNATGEIIVFIDGHTHIDNDQLIKNTALLMAEKEVSVLSRPQFLETPDNTIFQQAVALARKSTIGHGLDSTIYTNEDKYVAPTSSGASYKKEIFEEFGLYDERFDACEDVELNYRLAKSGYMSFTSMKLAVYYYPRNSLKGLFLQMSRYGKGRFRLWRKHPATLSIGTLLPSLFTLGVPLIGLLSIISNIIFALFLILLTLYVGVVVASSIYLSLRNGIKYFPILPAIYPTIHIGLGWGFLSEFWRTITGRGIDFQSEP